MIKTFQYNLSVDLNERLPLLFPMHDYAVRDFLAEKDKIIITTDDFADQDYDYSDVVGFTPKKLSIEFKDLCDEIYVNVSRFYPKNQFKEKHKNNLGSRVNIYDLQHFVHFYEEYDLQFNYLSVSYNEVIVFFTCNNKNNKASEVSVPIQCKEVIFTFTDLTSR